MQKFLVTNDDGVNAEGISVLASVLSKYGKVIVVAPDRNRSGQSHALSASEAIRLKKHSSDESVEIYSCTGTPVDCVKIGCDILYQEMGGPDAIFSGVNHGNNLGQALYTSGTIAAAREGVLRGIPSFALSTVRVGDGLIDSDKLEAVLSHLFEQHLFETLNHQGVVYNLNLPSCQVNQLKGIHVLPMDHFAERFVAEKHLDARGREVIWLNKIESKSSQEHEGLTNHYVILNPIDLNIDPANVIKETKALVEKHF